MGACQEVSFHSVSLLSLPLTNSCLAAAAEVLKSRAPCFRGHFRPMSSQVEETPATDKEEKEEKEEIPGFAYGDFYFVPFLKAFFFPLDLSQS